MSFEMLRQGGFRHRQRHFVLFNLDRSAIAIRNGTASIAAALLENVPPAKFDFVVAADGLKTA
jgi:hypothetical protein